MLHFRMAFNNYLWSFVVNINEISGYMYIYLIQKWIYFTFCLLLYAGHKLNVLDSVYQEVSLSFNLTLFKERGLLYFVKFLEEFRI